MKKSTSRELAITEHDFFVTRAGTWFPCYSPVAGFRTTVATHNLFRSEGIPVRGDFVSSRRRGVCIIHKYSLDYLKSHLYFANALFVFIRPNNQYYNMQMLWNQLFSICSAVYCSGAPAHFSSPVLGRARLVNSCLPTAFRCINSQSITMSTVPETL